MCHLVFARNVEMLKKNTCPCVGNRCLGKGRNTMQKLSGKTALITGGNSGIGLAAAKLFREHGARLAITGRDPASLEQARRTLGDGVLAGLTFFLLTRPSPMQRRSNS